MIMDRLGAAVVAADPAAGPHAVPPTDRLVAEALRVIERDDLRARSRRTGRRFTVSAAIAVAAAAVVAVSLVGLRAAPSAQAAISLGVFKLNPSALTLKPVPAGLVGPAVSGDQHGVVTSYVAPAPGLDEVGVSSTSQVRPELRGVVAGGGGERVAVAGSTGWVYRTPASSGAAAAVYVTWRESSGTWTEIGGEGGYADVSRLVGLAGSIVQGDRTVLPFEISVAPMGWHVAAFRTVGSAVLPAAVRTDPDTALGLIALAPGGEDATSSMTVSVVEYATTDTSFPTGRVRGTSEKVTSDGRAGVLLHNSDGWALQLRLDGGRSLVMLYPNAFSRAKVLEMSAAVSVD